MNTLEWMERLTLVQKFRLIEIAHETTDLNIKQAALNLLYPAVPIICAEMTAAARSAAHTDGPNQYREMNRNGREGIRSSDGRKGSPKEC